MDNTPGCRGTLLPRDLPTRESDPRLAALASVQEENPADLGRSSHNDSKTGVLSKKSPNTIRKKPNSNWEEKEKPDSSENERGRFPVRPHRDESPGDEGKIWQRYHQFLEADQAGAGIIAHDHTVDHKIVVIKEIKLHASKSQRRKLYKVLEDKPTNIVPLADLFLSAFSVYAIYEPLETSMHHIQATSRLDVTEIELAIFSKEVSVTGT